MVYKKKEGVEKDVSDAAAVMGRIGGSVMSPRKLKAVRRNAQFGGRPKKYTFENGVRARLGTRFDRECVIPDDVAKHPKKYKNKTFPAQWDDQRINVKIISISSEGVHVKRTSSAK